MAILDKYYTSQSVCGTVRLIAVPFGYGPRIAAENLARQLGIEIEQWKFCSDDTGNRKYKMLLNFGVPDAAGEPPADYKVWIDCLMWLRNKVPDGVKHYDLFLAEHFFDTHPEILNAGLPLKEIPPLISSNSIAEDESFTYNKGGHILVSFGGIETPFTTDVHRYTIPGIVLHSVNQASLELNDQREIICCCPDHIAAHFKLDATLNRIQFLSPKHDRFLQLLKQASIYIVQPGLYGPFEAFKYRIPTFFTTPFSYTQVCQALQYEKFNLLGDVPFWPHIKHAFLQVNGNIEHEELEYYQLLALIFEQIHKDENTVNEVTGWASHIIAGKNTREAVERNYQMVNLSKNNNKQIFNEFLNYMDVVKRNMTRDFIISDELFRVLDNLNETNIKDALDALEACVSNGWVGEAAEISDIIQDSGVVNERPQWRIILEIERMKRYQYFGFKKRAFKASANILEYLEEKADEISKSEYHGSRFTAIGHMGWLENDKTELEDRIKLCEHILNDCEESKLVELFDILQPFYLGLKGKFLFTEEKIEDGMNAFEDALKLVASTETVRNYAHILMHYVDELRQTGQPTLEKKATDLVQQFLFEKQPIKTHLLIRAYTFLLRSPSLSPSEIQDYSTRFQYIMFAMGLSQAYHIYPLIKEAKSVVPEKSHIDFYELNMTSLLEEKLALLGDDSDESNRNIAKGDAFERVAMQYYKDRGYTDVEKMDHGFQAFDFIAAKTMDDKRKIFHIVQVKNFKTKVSKNPTDFDRLNNALDALEIEKRDNTLYYDLVAYSGVQEGVKHNLNNLVKNVTKDRARLGAVIEKSDIIDFYTDSKNTQKLINFLNMKF